MQLNVTGCTKVLSTETKDSELHSVSYTPDIGTELVPRKIKICLIFSALSHRIVIWNYTNLIKVSCIWYLNID